MTQHWFIAHITKKYTTNKTLGLDLGCGYGNWDKFKQCKFVNVDQTKRNNVNIIHDLNQELLFQMDSFDVVICYNVLEYVTNDALLLKEIHRVLKPNGTFICITQNKLYPQGFLNDMISFAGFKPSFKLKDWLYATWYNNTSVYAFMVCKPIKI